MADNWAQPGTYIGTKPTLPSTSALGIAQTGGIGPVSTGAGAVPAVETDQKSAARRQIEAINERLKSLKPGDAGYREAITEKNQLLSFIEGKGTAPSGFTVESAPPAKPVTPTRPTFPAYDEKKPTLGGVLGAIYNTPNINPKAKPILERINNEPDVEKRQALIDELAKLNDPLIAAYANSLNLQNDRTRTRVAAQESVNQAKAAGLPYDPNLPPDAAGSKALGGGLPATGTVANQFISPTEVPTSMTKPAASPVMTGPKVGGQVGKGETTQTTQTAKEQKEDAQKKLDTMTSELKKTKDPAAWWQVLSAIADVAASAAFGYAGQRYETQASKDLQAQREAEQAEQEYARKMVLYNLENEVEAARAAEAREADRQLQMDILDKQQAYGSRQNAQENALRLQLAKMSQQGNLPPIASAFE